MDYQASARLSTLLYFNSDAHRGYSLIMNLLSDPRRRIGLAITAVGLLLVVLSNSFMGWLLIIVAGIIFACLALFRKESLWLLPGCLLIGIGLATCLTYGDFIVVDRGKKGGVFTFVASLGWFLATFLSTRTNGRLLLWTIIPGTLMIFLGWVAITREVLYIPLTLIRSYWAFIVVAIGLFIFSQDLIPSSDVGLYDDVEELTETPTQTSETTIEQKPS